MHGSRGGEMRERELEDEMRGGGHTAPECK